MGFPEGERDGGPVFARAGAAELPFADATFDAVVACLVFEHLEEPDDAIAEVARVLAPGGRFLFMLNHPLLQAPGSGWVDDHILEEQYWRVGAYLSESITDEEMEPDDAADVHDTFSIPQKIHELAEESADVLGGLHVRRSHYFDERHAGAVVVDQRLLGAVDAAGAAEVRRLAGVLLQVGALDGHPRAVGEVVEAVVRCAVDVIHRALGPSSPNGGPLPGPLGERIEQRLNLLVRQFPGAPHVA